MVHKTKAQVSIEFMIVISITLILFMFLFNIASDKSQQFAIQSSQLYAKQLTDTVAQEINSIYFAGNGAKKKINLPETLADNSEYSINFFPNYRLMEINYTSLQTNSKYSSFLVTSRIQTTLTNINHPINIENSNGKIIIT